MPRRGTLASVPVERLGRSTTTYSSAEATGIRPARATPGASEMMRVASRSRPLIISLSLPERRTIAVSAEAFEVMVLRKPSAIDSTATNTATTPATPSTAAAEAPRRWPMVRRLSQVTVATWESQFMSCLLHTSGSRPAQGLDDAQAHGLDGGEQSRHQAED